MNSDFKDLLQIFAEEEVEYLIIGAYAVMNYTQPRYTKDIALWIKPDAENSYRVARAFARFGVPLIEVTREDFAEEGLQYVIGVSPCQIDFLTTMPGAISFEDSWGKRETNKTKRRLSHPLPRQGRPHHRQENCRAIRVNLRLNLFI